MHHPLVCSKTKPIGAFYDTFCEMTNVQKAISWQFEDRSYEILEKLRIADYDLGDDESEIDEVIQDVILGESHTVERIPAWGDNEMFHIDLMKFGNAYWVSAIEFDHVGLFATLDDARDFALEYFSSFIEALDERELEPD